MNKIEKKVKLQRQSTDGTISLTLPKVIAQLKGWKPGDYVIVEFDVEKNEIKIKQ